MQGDGRLVAAGKLDKPRYTGLFDAFTKIKAAEGMGGFYAGCWPAIQRAALVNLGELTTYDTAKKSIVVYTGDNLLCHLCSAPGLRAVLGTRRLAAVSPGGNRDRWYWYW